MLSKVFTAAYIGIDCFGLWNVECHLTRPRTVLECDAVVAALQSSVARSFCTCVQAMGFTMFLLGALSSLWTTDFVLEADPAL